MVSSAVGTEGDAVGTTVNGFVAPGFEGVRAALESQDNAWGRGGGGISAWVKGELVVDLYGGSAAPGRAWQQDTLAPIASVTKTWAAVVVAQLWEKGLLDFTTPIATWWPEFAQHGKDKVTLHEIFMHSSGVLGFEGQVEFLDANDCAGWLDLDGIAQRLAASKPAWEPGTNHGYHAVSFGWLVQEVVRRVTGKTVGELFASEVAKPLDLDTHLGTHGADQDRVAHVFTPDLSNAPFLVKKLLGSNKAGNPRSLAGQALLGNGTNTILDRVDTYIDKPNFMAAEVPASNGSTTTSSMAKLYMALANGGTLDGVTILKPETIAELRKVRITTGDAVMTEPIPRLLHRLLPKARRTYGLSPNPSLRKNKLEAGPNPNAFVGQGFGGQLVMGDSDNHLSFASTLSDFSPGLDKKAQQPTLAALYAAIQ